MRDGLGMQHMRKIDEKCMQSIVFKNLVGRDDLVDLGVDLRMILKNT